MAEFAQALETLARKRLGGGGIAGLARITAGATQEIWRFELEKDGAREPLILRRAPGEGLRLSESAVGLETEAELIGAAAEKGVPVPAVRYVLAPEDDLGRGFVCTFVAGETLGGRIAKSDAFAAVRPKLAGQCGGILARLHTLEPERFPGLRRATTPELLAGYKAAYRAAGWPRPVFELAFRWLEDRMPPPPEAPRLVHGDFRNGNLIVDANKGVVAVLDWEIAHVADPMEDLGWICANCWRFGVEEKPVGGFGEREALWDAYEAAGGARVRRDHAHWWEVYGSLRWGVMCAGMTAAFRGADPSVERAVIARRASENEIDLLRLIAA
ncbi:MAG TPA: phosphotransferase family protein [Caulobacteraceae bacterium]|nr:phosphotransferase family protein [Caulobacteraceae bacterium]